MTSASADPPLADDGPPCEDPTEKSSEDLLGNPPEDLPEDPDAEDHPSPQVGWRPPAQRSAGLDERSRDILAFERHWWRHAGSKEQAIRDTFGLSGTRYYQLLNALLDNPAALAHDPVLVGRLRRLRARARR